MSKEEVIQSVMVSNHLPRNIAEAVVDDAGNVDQGKLQVAIAGISWGKMPAASADPGLVTALTQAYNQAKERNDARAMISLKNRIFKLGGYIT